MGCCRVQASNSRKEIHARPKTRTTVRRALVYRKRLSVKKSMISKPKAKKQKINKQTNENEIRTGEKNRQNNNTPLLIGEMCFSCVRNFFFFYVFCVFDASVRRA